MISANLSPEGFFPNIGCLIYNNTVAVSNTMITSVTIKDLIAILISFFFIDPAKSAFYTPFCFVKKFICNDFSVASKL